jgi:hypothetical protein
MKTRMIAVVGFVVGFGGLIADMGQAQSTGAQLNGSLNGLQSSEQTPTNLLARLSYDSTYVTDERGQPHFSQNFSRICFEVYRDGRYRISRMALGRTENLRGTLSEEQLSNVGSFLKKVDFDSKGGGIVRQGSETFVAEIVRGGQTVRFIWVDPDHHRPFPAAAESVIRWLQEFKAQGATALTAPESSTMQICPRMSDRPVQPVGERGANAGFACAPVSGIREDGAESPNLRRASTELPVKEISTMRK